MSRSRPAKPKVCCWCRRLFWARSYRTRMCSPICRAAWRQQARELAAWRAADDVDELPRPSVNTLHLCRKCREPFRSPADLDYCAACVKRSLRSATEPAQCAECGGTTRHGKPFCPDHVEQMPYAVWLLGRLHS